MRTSLNKNLITLISLILLVLILPAALLLVRQRQEIRKKAGSSPLVSVSSAEVNVGDVVVVTAKIPTNTTYADGTISYSLDSWDVVPSSFQAKVTNAVVFKGGLMSSAGGSGENTHRLITGAHDIGSPISGDYIQVSLRPKAATLGTTIYINYNLKSIDPNGNYTNNGPVEAASVAVSSVGGPTNSAYAPSIAAVGTGTDPYSVTLSLSASPAPTLFGGAVNAIKVLGTPTSAQPPASAWAGACSSTLPTGGVVYCSTTMQSSLNYVFNGSTPGTKYLWAIFHNDTGNTASDYWGASNGWSRPVATGSITLPAIPTATPTTVPGAPINGISAPATATVGTGTDPYSVTLSLSASPAPTLFGGAVNAIKVLGTPTSAQPPASAWSGACSSALPTGGAAYCSTTMQTSLNYVFNGSTPGTKYLWAIFHNDVGNTAAAYWGASNGWSSPVSTGAITLSAPATPTVPGAPINSVSAPATATVGTGTDPYSVLLSLSASPAPSLFAGAVNAIKILGTPTSAQPGASAWAIACSGTTPTGSAAYCSTTMKTSLNYVFNGSTPGTKYLWAIFHNDTGNTASDYWGASNGWSSPVSTGAISLPATPAISSISPSPLVYGGTMTINGTSFGTEPGSIITNGGSMGRTTPCNTSSYCTWSDTEVSFTDNSSGFYTQWVGSTVDLKVRTSSGIESAIYNVQLVSATPTVPGAPVNGISAPATATVGTGTDPYSVLLSLSASPAPSLFAGAANVIKVLGTPTSAQPPASAWSTACSGTLPTGGVVYCSPTMSSSLNYVFNGSTPGTKYLWAIFHNDVGNTAASYWGTSNGWSVPVRTDAINLPTLPSIGSVSPSPLVYGGTMTISGTGFGAGPGTIITSHSADINTVPCNTSSLCTWSDTQISVTNSSTSGIFSPGWTGSTVGLKIRTSSGLESATSNVQLTSPAPTVPGAPVNGISAPSVAAVTTGPNPYNVQVSLSASPAPSLFGGAANAVKVIGTPTSAQPPASAWAIACSSTTPTGSAAYCSTTMQSSVDYFFNGSTPGTKYLWAIFHNDVGNTAAAYWGTTNGWSSPVSTGAITLPGPSATPVCGNAAGETCCVNGPPANPYYCNLASNLYCVSSGVTHTCRLISSQTATVSDWNSSLGGSNPNLDFDNSGAVTSRDYALWLRAGGHL